MKCSSLPPTNDLVPAEFGDESGVEPEKFYIFNPSIISIGRKYAMCYRIIDSRGPRRRAIAGVILNNDLSLSRSPVLISDHILFPSIPSIKERTRIWHADPRFFKYRNSIYMCWNDGANKPINNQFVIEIDPFTLLPKERARLITVRGLWPESRRSIEKNWSFFESDGKLLTIYSIQPHVVLEVDLSDAESAVCTPLCQSEWESRYSPLFGEMRGGSAPLLYNRLVDNKSCFLAIAHSCYKEHDGRRYHAVAYEFDKRYPYNVLRETLEPIRLSGETDVFNLHKLNKEVKSVVYPTGLAEEDGSIIISYGINDERMQIDRIHKEELEAQLYPVYRNRRKTVYAYAKLKEPKTSLASSLEMRQHQFPIPLSWWDCRGKLLDRFRKETFEVGNFGDIASKEIVELISGKVVIPRQGVHPALLAIGSVAHTARDGDIIWGSGVKSFAAGMPHTPQTISIVSVRGPLTYEYFRSRGYDVSGIKDMFDPGSLAGYFYKHLLTCDEAVKNDDPLPITSRPNYRIIPHFSDYYPMLRKNLRHAHAFVSVDCAPIELVKQLRGAEVVYSSSLHGIIFAESLGIPACWIRPMVSESPFKYSDYYLGTSRTAHMRPFDSIEEAFRHEAPPLPALNPEAMLSTFPHQQVTGLLKCYSIKPGYVYRQRELLSVLFPASEVESVNNSGVCDTTRPSEHRHKLGYSVNIGVNNCGLLSLRLSLPGALTEFVEYIRIISDRASETTILPSDIRPNTFIGFRIEPVAACPYISVDVELKLVDSNLPQNLEELLSKVAISELRLDAFKSSARAKS